jgi:nucleotide exchange factor SIL1
MPNKYLPQFGRIVFSLVLIYCLFCSLTSAASPPASSPAAQPELICHTDNPAECYLKVFSPTEEFQVVYDDQDLPPGLHVQLDVQTGQKQAKLYNPDEENPALAGLPVNHDVLVVDPELPPDAPRIPAGAPAYDPIGVVKAPQEKNGEFYEALQTLKKSSEGQQSVETSAIDGALQLLEDLSHDMYYGLEVAEDTEAVQSLFCLLSRGSGVEGEVRPLMERVDFLASSVLSSTVRNNPPALAAIEKSWDIITGQQCKPSTHSIKHDIFHGLAPLSAPGTEQESEEADTLRLNLAVISGLLKAPKIRAEFLENDGMQSFLQILLREGEVWKVRRAKVAQIITDTFLDEDFGATLGLWPRKKQAVDSAKCTEGALDDECWGYHLGKISQVAEAPEWSQQLLSLIQQTQVPGSQSETTPEHNEL